MYFLGKERGRGGGGGGRNLDPGKAPPRPPHTQSFHHATHAQSSRYLEVKVMQAFIHSFLSFQVLSGPISLIYVY